MISRRLTIFPKTGHALQTTVRDRNEDVPKRGSNRIFNNADKLVDLELPKALSVASERHKVFTPVEDDPERFYQCIYLVDPEGTRPYCLAQEKMLTTNECPYRIVMIRRTTIRAVVGPSKPSHNLLNIISAFRFNDSLYTVFDRPGLSLSEISLCHHPQLGLAQIQTISKEVG
jgi:hypothetical protein